MEWIKKLDRKLDGTALAKARDAAVRGVKKFALNESELEIATEEATNGEPWGPHGTAMAGEFGERRGAEREKEGRRKRERGTKKQSIGPMPVAATSSSSSLLSLPSLSTRRERERERESFLPSQRLQYLPCSQQQNDRTNKNRHHVGLVRQRRVPTGE